MISLRQVLGAISVLSIACSGSVDVERAERAAEQAERAAQQANAQVEQGLQEARVRVEEVGHDLENAAGRVQHGVEQVAADAIPPTQGIDDAALLREAPQAIACTEGACTIARAFADKLRGQPTTLAAQAKIDPEHRDGRVVGMRVSELGEIAKLLGFQDRDVIVSINGMPLRTLQSVPQLYLQLRSATRFTVEYERGSQRATKRIEIV